MLLNDATFLLDESLAKLIEIRATQQLMNSPQWQSYFIFSFFIFYFFIYFVIFIFIYLLFSRMTPDQKRERAETHMRAERMVSSCIFYIRIFFYYYHFLTCVVILP